MENQGIQTPAETSLAGTETNLISDPAGSGLIPTQKPTRGNTGRSSCPALPRHKAHTAKKGGKKNKRQGGSCGEVTAQFPHSLTCSNGIKPQPTATDGELTAFTRRFRPTKATNAPGGCNGFTKAKRKFHRQVH